MSSTATRQVTAVAIADSASGPDSVIACGPDQSILLAGLQAGVDLPYECASGGCGSCKAVLLEGSVSTRWPDATGLSERDRRQGNRILLCQSVPDTGCRVRVRLGGAGNPPARPVPTTRRGVLAQRTLLSRDTAQFYVQMDEPVSYLPGQFVILEFADGVRRAYSMSRCAPAASGDAVLELLVRAKPGGAGSEWLFDRLQIGGRLVVEGPYGKAHAQSPDDRPVVCLAGGTGLAPVLAIAEHLVAASPDRRLDLYVGARELGDVVLADRLLALAERGASVVVAVEGQPDRDHPLLGQVRVGLALAHLAADVPDLAHHDVYLAGPTPMIDASLRQLLREGTAAADRVFFDRFLA